MIIAAGQFKAECLKLMDRVKENHEEIIISKRGKPVAKLVPYGNEPVRSIFGYIKNSIKNQNNIIEPSGDSWDAEK